MTSRGEFSLRSNQGQLPSLLHVFGLPYEHAEMHSIFLYNFSRYLANLTENFSARHSSARYDMELCQTCVNSFESSWELLKSYF